MRAIILAAGDGSRLHDIEPFRPKPMVKVGLVPVLQSTVLHMSRLEIRDITITVRYKKEAIMGYFGDGHVDGVAIKYSEEEGLLGTAGGVKRAVTMYDRPDEPFVVWYGDNFSTCNLRRMLEYHNHCRSAATIAVHWRTDVRSSGVVEWEGSNRITAFTEKPTRRVRGGFVNAGIYILEPSVIETLPDVGDFGRDVFPRMLVEGADLYAYGLSYDEMFRWFDTAEDLRRLREEY